MKGVAFYYLALLSKEPYNLTLRVEEDLWELCRMDNGSKDPLDPF
jgi:hypothetical protein